MLLPAVLDFLEVAAHSQAVTTSHYTLAHQIDLKFTVYLVFRQDHRCMIVSQIGMCLKS
jgi:hypothetical protein